MLKKLFNILILGSINKIYGRAPPIGAKKYFCEVMVIFYQKFNEIDIFDLILAGI